MKKLLFTLICALTTTLTASAIDDLVIASFEENATNEHGVSILKTTASGFDVNHYDVLPDVRDNPVPGGLNSSAKCLTMTLKSTAKRWGAIAYLDFVTDLTPAIMAERKFLKIMVWREIDATNMRVSFAKRPSTARGGNWNDGTNVYAGKPTKGEWVDIVIDLSREVTADGTNSDAKGTKFKWQDKEIWSLGLQNMENATTSLGYPFTVYYDNVVLSADPMPRGSKIFASNNVEFNFENANAEAEKWLVNKAIHPQSTLNTFEIIDNPVKDDINNTIKVLKFNKSADCNWWEGGPRFAFDALVPLTKDTLTYLHTFIYVPSDATTTPIPLTVQFNASDWTGNINQAEFNDYIFDAGKWVDMVMEIDKLTHIKQFAIRFDIQKNEANQYIKTPAAYYYIDGVVLNNDPEPREKLTTGLVKKNYKSDLITYNAQDNKLTVNAMSDMVFSLYNSVGQLLIRQNLKGQSTTSINVSNGIYLMSAVGVDGRKVTERIVVR